MTWLFVRCYHHLCQMIQLTPVNLYFRNLFKIHRIEGRITPEVLWNKGFGSRSKAFGYNSQYSMEPRVWTIQYEPYSMDKKGANERFDLKDV